MGKDTRSSTLRARKTLYRKRYGISLEQFDEMARVQNGVCAICKRPETMKRKNVLRRLSVDHEHSSGKVRGLLCAACNAAIGYIGDDPIKAQALTDYLIRTQSSKPKD